MFCNVVATRLVHIFAAYTKATLIKLLLLYWNVPCWGHPL